MEEQKEQVQQAFVHPLARRAILTDNHHGRDGVASLVSDWVWIGENLLIIHALFHATDIESSDFSFGLLVEGMNATDIQIKLHPELGQGQPQECTVTGALKNIGSSFLASQVYVPSFCSTEEPKCFYYVSMQIRLLVPRSTENNEK